MRYLLLITLLFTTGCASVTLHRDSNGDVFKVDTRGNIEAEITPDKTYVNSKTEPFKDIFNLQLLKGS